MKAHEEVARAFMARHPREAARRLELEDPALAAGVLAAVPAAVGAEVFDALGPTHAASCAAALTEEQLAGILAFLTPDAGVAALRRLGPERRESVLERLEEEVRGRLSAKLSFANDTAGALADPLVPALPEDLTVAEAKRQLRRDGARGFHELYIVTRDRALVGTLALPDLMEAPARESLAVLMRADPARLDAHDELPVIVGHPAWLDRDELPVVDRASHLVGAIRHQTLRRLSWQPQRPMVATLLGLSEAYWAGLSGILASLTPPPQIATEDEHVT